MLLSLLLVASVPQTNCLTPFVGSWALTAEGAPYVVLRIVDGKWPGQLGVIQTRVVSGGDLNTVISSGPIMSRPLSSDDCTDTVLKFRYPGTGATPTRMRFVRAADGTLQAELLDIPPEFDSPKFRLIKVDPSVEAESFEGERQRDVLASPADSPEMAAIFIDDQAIRTEAGLRRERGELLDKSFMDRWEKSDIGLLRRTRELLSKGALTTGRDYWRAAFIFQHGGTSSAYLQAHHLANVAMKLGYRDAAWIAAASLDRYLLSIGQSQIYGTQYQVGKDGQWARRTIDASILSDEDRSNMNVPKLSVEGR